MDIESEVIMPEKKSAWKWVLILFIILFLVAIILAGASVALAFKYDSKIYPGVKIDDVDLGGLTKTQAENIIGGKFKQTFSDGFVFKALETEKRVSNDENVILQLNLESMVQAAFDYGKDDQWWQKYPKILAAPVFKKKIKLDYSLDKELLKESLQAELASLEKPAKNAELKLSIIDVKEKHYKYVYSPSSTGGQVFDYATAIAELEENLVDLRNPTIILDVKIDKPEVTSTDAEKLEPVVADILELDNLTFEYEGDVWTVTWLDFTNWLAFGLNEDEEPSIVLNEEMLKGKLESISQDINQEAVNAKLQMKESKVTEFQASQNGLELDIEATSELAEVQIIKEREATVELIVNIVEPEITLESINDLGIKEIIGSGWSDFSYSPSNRRHNIGVGAAAVHGTLVAPGDEFSLVKAFVAVDAEHGYKPELVIKVNETVPEYGGGLCQVATTIFRAALDAGLKITSRRNHSYRVSYYEPAGTDATIYMPQPDVRFQNDTDKHVLVQSRLWGNNLQFDIWGAEDGRTVKFVGKEEVTRVKDLVPKIFNITSPGEPKEIETTELEPGEKRRTESAHYGADTVFYRTVTFADGEEEEETYRSHYVPWQEVWLVGVDPEQKEEEAKEIMEEQEQSNLEDSLPPEFFGNTEDDSL
jgi:vancomycin resistance protein YoaR